MRYPVLISRLALPGPRLSRSRAGVQASWRRARKSSSRSSLFTNSGALPPLLRIPPFLLLLSLSVPFLSPAPERKRRADRESHRHTTDADTDTYADAARET
eukprot:3058312-Rhodomonas_salina.1